jgi:two-component system cell cycle response regulator
MTVKDEDAAELPWSAPTQNSMTALRGQSPWHCRILIVDNDDAVRAKLAAFLALAGYDVDTASCAEEALRLHKIEPFQVVLSDWYLPDTDGPALCRKLRGISPQIYVYVLILVAEDLQRRILGGLAAGADDVVFKDGDPEVMLARLNVGRRIMSYLHELRVSSQESHRLALTDALTETHNRRYLMSTLPSEIARSNRYRHPLSILCCDIDMFKRVNDHFGHDAGDDVLREFVVRSRNCLRQPVDWIARSGGEEFVIVMPETDIAGAICVADRIRRAIAGHPIPTCSGPLHVTVSIGATSLETTEEYDHASVIDLLRAADRCLYVSKRLGRDRATALSVTAANSLRLDSFETGMNTPN